MIYDQAHVYILKWLNPVAIATGEELFIVTACRYVLQATKLNWSRDKLGGIAPQGGRLRKERLGGRGREREREGEVGGREGEGGRGGRERWEGEGGRGWEGEGDGEAGRETCPLM